MEKRKITLTAIILGVVLVALFGSTYAYFTSNTSSKISNNTTIQTGVLKLVLDDGTNKDGVLTGTIDPNNTKFTTYLSITNEGTYDTFAKIYFKGLTNTFSSDLVYSIEEVDSLPNNGSTPKIVKRIKYQVPIPGSLTSSRELLADGLLIKMGTLNGNNLTPNTEYYRVTVEYLYSDTVDQSSDMGKTFYTGFDIEQGDKLTETIVMIDNIEQLVELANEVNAGDTKSGKEYRLMRNLDFNDDESYLDATQTTYGDINKNGTIEPIKTELTTGAGWTPIGTETNPYSGDFNGQNYELKNLYINNSSNNLKLVGLFGKINNSSFNNLGVVDENISTINGAHIGGIVGELIDSNIAKCYATVTTKNDNVYNINNNDVNYHAGGLVGHASGVVIINNSYNSQNVKGGYSSGGIVGWIGHKGIKQTSVTIQNSYNSGNIYNEKHSVGGIVGISSYDESVNSNALIISNCYNEGKITTNIQSTGESSMSGGIIGYSYLTNSLVIDRSYNIGIVKNMSTNYSNSTNCFIGGIIGLSEQGQENNITNSYNTGNLISGSYMGGIAADIDSSKNTIISKCYNTGNLTSSTHNYFQGIFLGGIMGTQWNSKKTFISSSGNNGSLSIVNNLSNGNINMGGIISAAGANNSSYNSSLSIINSYSKGNMSSTKAYTVSGINGQSYYNNSSHNNVYNLGRISGTITNKQAIDLNSQSSTISATHAYFTNADSLAASNVSSVNNNSTSMSSAQMKDASFVTTLNNNRSSITLPSELSGYTLSTWCTSDNGPVLDFEVPESERATRCPAYTN